MIERGSVGTTSGEPALHETENLELNSNIVLQIVEKYGTRGDGCSEERDECEEDSSDDDEYLFPTPDEIHNAKPLEEGMIFSTLDEAVRYVNIFGKLSGFALDRKSVV